MLRLKLKEIRLFVLQKSKVKPNSLYAYLLITGIILVAFNLRPAITSVGPVVGMIKEDIGLSYWSVSLLTSLPLIAFAVISPIAPKIATKLSNEKALLWGLVCILAGIVVRSFSMVILLFAGTFLIGTGISICNVLLPVIIKDKYPKKFGLMTSVYSTAMGLMASLASGLSVPLAINLNLGWKNALLVWIIPALIGILLWIYLVKNSDHKRAEIKTTTGDNTIWRSPLAWQVAFYMGFQSFLFYVTITWLPEILQNLGASVSTAGWLLSFTQLIGLPAGFIVPVLAGHIRSQRSIAAILGLTSVLGYSGLLLFGTNYPVMITSIILIGIGLGGTFPLGLAFLGLRSKNARQAAELSGMAQSIGYILAAIGPIFIGSLYDFTHTWTIPLITLIIVSVIVITFGIGAGRNKFV
jgi:CP family cyanate transporter-like MFS transporter